MSTSSGHNMRTTEEQLEKLFEEIRILKKKVCWLEGFLWTFSQKISEASNELSDKVAEQ